MSVTVIVGGQFGSEGKGKTTAHLCRNRSVDAVVRCGGPNSGHTVSAGEKQVILRQLPAGVIDENVKLFLAAGCLIDIDVLFEEIERFDVNPTRLEISPNAVIIDSSYKQEERERKLGENIGSTCSGTGVAVANRALRSDVTLARDLDRLKPYLANVSQNVIKIYSSNQTVVVEGTQGYGLSVYHSQYYPNATSRDTTAAAFLSEVGISPRATDEIIMVLRTYPIRVGGNSGPLPKETNWKEVRVKSGYPHEIREFTSVTKKERRVAQFDFEMVERAAAVNEPTQISLMGTDYLDYTNSNADSFLDLTNDTKQFVEKVEDTTNAPVTILGTGPSDNQIIDTMDNDE